MTTEYYFVPFAPRSLVCRKCGAIVYAGYLTLDGNQVHGTKIHMAFHKEVEALCKDAELKKTKKRKKRQ